MTTKVANGLKTAVKYGVITTGEALQWLAEQEATGAFVKPSIRKWINLRRRRNPRLSDCVAKMH